MVRNGCKEGKQGADQVQVGRWAPRVTKGPGRALGRAAGGVCVMVAPEKGTRDKWNCHRILCYS